MRSGRDWPEWYAAHMVAEQSGANDREEFLMGEPKSAAGPRLLQRAAAEAEKLAVPVNDADHLSGPPDAMVTLLEYGDYDCFYCGAAENMLRVVQERLTTPIRFVFRHFPLTEVHEHAELAALAAEAAGAQGKFWQMHAWLFQHQRTLELNQMVQEAADLGLEVERFRADLEQQAFKTRIDADLEGGLQSGVTGVPTFFINGVRHVGSYRPPRAGRRRCRGEVGGRWLPHHPRSSRDSCRLWSRATALASWRVFGRRSPDGRSPNLAWVTEIRLWFNTVATAFDYTMEILAAESSPPAVGLERHNLRVRLQGNFPGGVADLTYDFSLRDGLIAELQMAP